MNKISRRKLLIIITIVFAFLNIIWFSITSLKYDRFVKVIPKNRGGKHAMRTEDGYNYSVKKPAYLHYTGNLAISNGQKGELLIIWPLITGGYEYGFRLQESDAVYEVYVDKNMKPIDKEDKYIATKVEEHKEGLNTLFLKANEMWKLE